MTLLKSLAKIVDLSKVSIGFETLGTDIMVEYESYQDKALPWSTAPIKSHKPPTPYSKMVYYKPCNEDSKNGTKGHKDSKRCGNPLLWQQWGPKFSAKDSDLKPRGTSSLDDMIRDGRENRAAADAEVGQPSLQP
mgnify:CR=1 FL=1